MPRWLDILIGIVAGTSVVGIALLWACWPRQADRKSWFAPPTGEAGDPVSGESQWQGDGHGGGSGHGGADGHGL